MHIIVLNRIRVNVTFTGVIVSSVDCICQQQAGKSGDLKAHVHPRDIAHRVEFRTIGKSENQRQAPNQNAETITKQQYKRAIEHGPLSRWKKSMPIQLSLSSTRYFLIFKLIYINSCQVVKLATV